MLRIFSAVTVCTILATQMPSKALSSTATLGKRFIQFLQASFKRKTSFYTTKASYQQKGSRVDCVKRTKIPSVGTRTRLCMQSKLNNQRLQPKPVKITYRRERKCNVVTESWDNHKHTLTILYVGDTCVVYRVKGKKPLTPGKDACGIWRKNIVYPLPENDECQGNATEACGSDWRDISSYNKCTRVQTPKCKDYQDE
uniref:Putative secreted protein n=1 Tax=Ixodes ricinus TaxID=34613 RepID=A0A090XB76_IXORI